MEETGPRRREKRWRGGTYIWFDETTIPSAVIYRHWWQRRWRFRVFYGRKIGTGVQSIRSFKDEAQAIEAVTELSRSKIVDLDPETN
jgi:hypothetical protein